MLYRNNSYGTAMEKEQENVELCHSKQDYIHVYPGKFRCEGLQAVVSGADGYG